MVEPGLAADRIRFTAQDDFTGRLKARDGVIMRRTRSVGSLHAHAIFAMDDRRFRTVQMQTQRPEIDRGRKIEIVRARRCKSPIFDPGDAVSFVEAGFSKRASAHLLVELKFSAGHVSDREVCKLQIVDDKTGRLRIPLRYRFDSLTEECQLVAETPILPIEKISGEIPPL